MEAPQKFGLAKANSSLTSLYRAATSSGVSGSSQLSMLRQIPPGSTVLISMYWTLSRRNSYKVKSMLLITLTKTIMMFLTYFKLNILYTFYKDIQRQGKMKVDTKHIKQITKI